MCNIGRVYLQQRATDGTLISRTVKQTINKYTVDYQFYETQMENRWLKLSLTWASAVRIAVSVLVFLI
jgi:hypothetical protein